MATSKLKNNDLLVRLISVQYTAPANAHASFNLYAESAYAGYTPIGLVGYKTNIPEVYCVNACLENTSVGVFLHNISSSAKSSSFHAYVLYQKN